jgi:hypothetical protein
VQLYFYKDLIIVLGFSSIVFKVINGKLEVSSDIEVSKILSEISEFYFFDIRHDLGIIVNIHNSLNQIHMTL